MSKFVNIKIKTFNGQAATMGLFLTKSKRRGKDDEPGDSQCHRKLEPGEVVRVTSEEYERRLRQPNSVIEQTLDSPTRPLVFTDAETARWSSPSTLDVGAGADASRAKAKADAKAQAKAECPEPAPEDKPEDKPARRRS